MSHIFFFRQYFFAAGVMITIIVRNTEKYQKLQVNILRYEEFLKQETTESKQ